MILYANGCSMTAGHELPEDQRLQLAWPARLAEKLGMDAHNDALQGTSNDRIYRRTLAFIADWVMLGRAPTDLFVAIGWTTPHRREVALAEFEHDDDNAFYRTIYAHRRSRVEPRVLKDLERLYCDHVECEREAHDRFFGQVIGLQSLLCAHGIRYLFCSALEIPVGDSSLTGLVDQTRYMDFDSRQHFHSYVTLGGYALAPHQHPLADGHEMWAEKLAQFTRSNHLCG